MHTVLVRMCLQRCFPTALPGGGHASAGTGWGWVGAEVGAGHSEELREALGPLPEPAGDLQRGEAAGHSRLSPARISSAAPHFDTVIARNALGQPALLPSSALCAIVSVFAARTAGPVRPSARECRRNRGSVSHGPSAAAEPPCGARPAAGLLSGLSNDRFLVFSCEEIAA